MWNDVSDLKDFYQTRRGEVAQRMIEAGLKRLWPEVSGETILGLGFATPYLDSFRGPENRVLAFMPGTQGALVWPKKGAGLVAMGHEARLPFADNSIERILLVHALESCEELRGMLREIWRVISAQGRLVVIVPNRRGIWAQLDISPFGHGHPFTPRQLSRLLGNAMFTPASWEGVLFAPPFSSQTLPSTAPLWEKIGQRWFKTFAGVILMEATKQIYAATPREESRQRAFVRALDGSRKD